MRLPLALLLLALPVAASAQVLTKAPALERFVEATYPPDAQAQGLMADVLLEVDIGETGDVLDARVVQPAGNGFDEAAIAAVKQFKFTPAELDGKPAAVTIEYLYSFKMAPPPQPEETASAEEKPGIVNLRGTLLERGTRKPIAGATVDIADGAVVVRSDANGYFEAEDVPEGEVKVVVADSAHEKFETTEVIQPGKMNEVTYYVRTRVTSPYETVVVGKKERKEVSTVAISKDELTKIPGTSGDAVRVIQNLPGVARSAFPGQNVIRGGNPDDTRVYVDGVEVPLIFHFGGISSVYASELVEEVQFEPGNFGARYGRATAGRIELITRTPRKGPLHLVADMDLFDATGLAEGPVSDDVRVAVAARRSYVDAVLLAATEAAPDAFGDVGFSIAPRYYDWQTKVAYDVDERNELKFDFYGSNDALAVVGVDTGSVANVSSLSTTTTFTKLALTWNHRVSADTRLRLLFAPGWDHFDFDASPLFFSVDAYSANGRAEAFHKVSKSLEVGAGLDMLYSQQILDIRVPAPEPPGQIEPPDFRENLVSAAYDVSVLQPAIWTEAIWQPIEQWKLVPGLRVDYDSFIESMWVDPRFSTRFAFSEQTTLKGGVGMYHQPPQPQYVVEEFGNPEVGAEGSIQYMLGAEQRIVGPVSLDLQLYYKDLFDLVTRSRRVIERDGQRVLENYTNEGTGRAYGAEALLRYDPDGRFFGWIAYSLSRTERDMDSSTGMGPPGGDRSDQPHNLVALGTLEVPEVWDGLSFGFRVRYTTGNPASQCGGAVYDVDADEYDCNWSQRSRDVRLPDFFQLDLRVDKKWTFDTSTFTAYLDVQNVTNRENAEGIQRNFDYSESALSPGLPIFPSFGLRFEY